MRAFAFRSFLFLVAFAALVPLRAENAGATGAAFLKLGVGARAMGMGEAYTAEASSVDSLYWNPAGLINTWRPTLLVSYKPIVEDTAQSQAALALRHKNIGFGAGYNGVSYKSIDAYDDGGNELESYDAADHSGVVGVAIGSQKISAGLVVKFIQSKIADESASAIAADAGILMESPLSPSIFHALVVKNLGGGIKFYEQEDALPLSATLGNSLKFKNRYTLTLDAIWRSKDKAAGAAGLEYSFSGDRFSGLALRGGYNTGRNEIDGMSGLSFGAGFGFGPAAIDYAWVPYGELGNSHAVSLLWNLPNIKWPKKKK